MSKKKIFWIVLFIFIIGICIVGITSARHQDIKKIDTSNNILSNISNDYDGSIKSNIKSDNLTPYKITELSDGILYSKDGEQVTADITLGDNFFDTTIMDMNLNPDSYVGKKIQIDGLFFANAYYSFVGRYTTSNLCPTCPAGVSFMEIHLDGTIDREFSVEEDWIKVIGIFKVGNDESSDFQDYYYLDVVNLEVMNEKGNDTVNN